MRTVADRLAAFISWLKKDFNVSLDQVHLIGHSLGAHVAGNAGDLVIQHLGQAVGRITGERAVFMALQFTFAVILNSSPRIFN